MQVIQSKTNPSTKLLYILPITSIVMIAILYMSVSIGNALTNVHAEESTLTNGADKSFTVSSDRTITVAISTESIDLDLTPSAAGEFETSPNPLTITVSTNNPTGYNLNMTTTTTNLTRTAPLSGQTPVIQTLSSSGSFTADNFETNAWGFSLDGTNFEAISLSRQINQTIKEANSSTTDLTFGVKLNNEIPSGSYNTTLTFIATTNPLESNFDTAFDAAGKTQVSYNGQNYYKMQDMSGFICSMVATPTDATALTTQSTQLIDTRDNKIYWVSKLLDGNCWMTQNLDFDINDTTKQYLTSEYTDLVASGASPYATADGYSMDANGKITWTPVRNTIVSTTTSASYTWPNDPYTPYSLDLGDWYYRSDYYNNDDCGDQECNYHTGSAGTHFSQTAGANGTHSHVGNYYNWSAAVASNNTNGYNSGTPSNSICPKGWKLPANGGVNDNGTYSNLNKLYNGDITTASELGSTAAADKLLLTSPLYFVRAGNVWSSALHSAGLDGTYWSSTVINASNAYSLYFRSSGVWPSNNDNRLVGRSVRCLARTDLTIEDATYLQDVTPEMRQNTAEGTEVTLLDKRDGNDYTVKKINGNIWMTQNLRITGVVSATDSNFTGADVNISVAGLIEDTLANDVPRTQSGYDNLGEPTVWYNLAAASAGTIIGGPTSDVASDICPAGWNLPSKTESESVLEYEEQFSPVAGGSYRGRAEVGNDDGLYVTHEGLYWGSTRNVTNDWNLLYGLFYSVGYEFSVHYDYAGQFGFYIRCVLK
ncbi:hypothetical protein IJ117_02390 [Candidatus Saccharibacteria bacterium]|nr:hypothetical protein [Candidatus Saccharibacteria bacterium]